MKEAFGEIQLPILKDMPFFHELTASGAARVSDYNSAVGTVWTYNAGLDWSPIRDIRFRGNYSRALRAPNLSETGFPAVANFAPGFADPCNSTNIGNNPNRAANCQTDLGALLAGLPNVTLLAADHQRQQRGPGRGNVGLLDARLRVIQPRFIPGLSLSVDYYKIKVKNVIVSLSAQTIVNSCYDERRPQQSCSAPCSRVGGSGPGPLGEQPGQVPRQLARCRPANFAGRHPQGHRRRGRPTARVRST